MPLGHNPPSAATPAAAPQPQRQAPHVTPKLVCESTGLVPGQTAWLGLDLKIQPKWHIYWPGLNDTGTALSLKVTAPAGFAVGSTVWPAPHRLLAPGNELDHVYEDHVMLLIPVEVPKDAKPGDSTISVEAKWVVCADLCLPEQATSTISIPVVAPGSKPKASPEAPLFAAARQRIPSPLKPESDTKARIDHRTFVVECPAAAHLSFFPLEDSAPMPHLSKEGDAAAARLSIQIEPESPKARVKGVIEVVKKGEKQPAFYSVDLEVPRE